MSAGRIELGGVLGEALAANLHGRLLNFIVDEHSPAIALFSPEQRAGNLEGDWYGEHAGKWLYAAAKAVMRSGDPTLAAHLRRVADYLASVQEADGYLGTYAPERRFTVPQPPKPVSWDGAPALRTWDMWTHSYLVLGLVETWRALGEARHLEAAARIGDLCLHTLRGGIDVNSLGNHHGMSATVLLDAAVELHFASGEQRFLDLALLVLEQVEANPALRLLGRALEGADASEIATGKAYQLIWNLVGLAKLHRATGKAEYLTAVENLWRSIRDHHLTLGGGPWGGVAHRSREVFNPANVFSPQGYVETCSVLAWLQLNRELLRITGAARYAEEIERTAYNDLLGAAAPNGEDWCYYSFPNGKRVHTTYWRCCKSSGAMALEELPGLAYAATGDGLRINLLGPGSARLRVPAAGDVTLTQRTNYPFDGDVVATVEPERAAAFAVEIRIPSWARDASAEVDGRPVGAVVAGEWLRIEREWRPGDRIRLRLPMAPALHFRSNRNVQESRAPDGSEVKQQVLRFDYVALSRGPLAYATGLIDEFKFEETIRLPDLPPPRWLREHGDPATCEGVGIAMDLGYRAPLAFVPYYRAGGRNDGAWRLTWLSLAPGDG
ncbi:MAG: glycoside hydrolase family 127 protein [Pseudoxanthomonas sp.]